MHTRGPWIAVGWYVETPVDEYADICSCHPADFGQRSLPRDEAEIRDNARLIAAAPLMLHELYAAAAQIEAFGGDASTQRAAIAKATGEAA